MLLPILSCAQTRSHYFRVGSNIIQIDVAQESLDVRAIARNIRARLEQLNSVAALDSACYQSIWRIVAEIDIILDMLPQDIMNAPVPVHEIEPMAAEPFANFLIMLEEESFSDDQLLFLREVARKNFFVTAQLARILDVFSFSEDKLEAARIVLPRLLDPGNAFMLRDKFTFESDKEEFMKIISE